MESSIIIVVGWFPNWSHTSETNGNLSGESVKTLETPLFGHAPLGRSTGSRLASKKDQVAK